MGLMTATMEELCPFVTVAYSQPQPGQLASAMMRLRTQPNGSGMQAKDGMTALVSVVMTPMRTSTSSSMGTNSSHINAPLYP